MQKIVGFVVLPRLHEFVKLRNREQGDYFAFSVVQITHREDGPPELWLHLSSFVGGRSVVSFIEDHELDDYVTGYKQEGWVLASLVTNRTFRDDGESVWSDLAVEDDRDACA